MHLDDVAFTQSAFASGGMNAIRSSGSATVWGPRPSRMHFSQDVDQKYLVFVMTFIIHVSYRNIAAVRRRFSTFSATRVFAFNKCYAGMSFTVVFIVSPSVQSIPNAVRAKSQSSPLIALIAVHRCNLTLVINLSECHIDRFSSF